MRRRAITDFGQFLVESKLREQERSMSKEISFNSVIEHDGIGMDLYERLTTNQALRNLILTVLEHKNLTDDEFYDAKTLVEHGVFDDADVPMYAIHEDMTVSDFEFLMESIIDKFKEKAAAAAEKVKKGGKKALDTLSKGAQIAMKVGGNILALLKPLVGKLVSIAKNAFDTILSKTMSAFDKIKDKLAERGSKVIKDEKDVKTLKNEAATLNSIVKGGINWIKGFSGGIKGAFDKAVNVDDKEEKALQAKAEEEANKMKTYGADKKNESLNNMNTFEAQCESAYYSALRICINRGEFDVKELDLNDKIYEGDDIYDDGLEKFPYISKIAFVASIMPPFVALTAIKKLTSLITGGVLKMLNIVGSNLWNAPYVEKWIILPTITGLAAELMAEHMWVEGKAKVLISGVFKTLFPNFGVFLMICEWVAKGIAFVKGVEVVFTIVKAGQKTKEEK